MYSSMVPALIATCALLTALLLLIAAASRHKKRATGSLHLIGSIARVETDLKPEGSVIIKGELWRARVRHGGEPLRRGCRARVVGASNHLLEVEPSD